jgi:hypothetical protein
LEIGIVGADIAEPLARPPLASIIVSPDKGVDDCVKIRELNVGNEYNSREFAIAVKVFERYYTCYIGDGGKKYSADEIGRERRSRGGCRPRNCYYRQVVTTEQVD